MTSHRVGLLAAVVCAAVLAELHPLGAQQPPSVAPGQRVRMVAPSAGGDTAVGTILAVRGREIVVKPDAPRPDWSHFGRQADAPGVTVSVDSLRSLEVRTGTRTHFWAGAGVGAAIGGLVLGVAGAAGASNCSGFICFSPAAVGAAGLVVGGVIGGLVGGMIGGLNVTDEWTGVPLGEGKIGLIVAPNGRLGLGASLAF